jgi:hypothetical protein
LKEEFVTFASGGYAPIEAAWHLADQQINGDYGVDQLGASLTEVQRLINYRLQNIPGLQQLGPLSANPYTGQAGTTPAIEQAPAATAPAADDWTQLPDGNSIRLKR